MSFVVWIKQPHLKMKALAKEPNYHSPHVHLIFKGTKVASIDLYTFEVRDSKVEGDVEKKAVELAKRHAEEFLADYRRKNGK